jgi:nucleoside-diphosphate-sugar epimerase
VIGKQLFKRLNDEGYEVVGSRRLNQEPIQGLRDIEICPWMPINLQNFSPDYVVNLAGYYGYSNNSVDIKSAVDANIGLAVSISELMTRLKVPVIATGSFSEKYTGPGGLGYYAASKIAAKSILVEAALTNEVQLSYVYLYDTYSVDTSRKKFIDLLWNLKKNSKPLQVSGGAQVQDLVHVEDIVLNYFQLLSKNEYRNENCLEWQIRTGKQMTLLEIAKIVQEVKGFELPIEWGQIPYRQRDVFHLWDCAPYLNDRNLTQTLRKGLLNMRENYL